MDKAIICVDDDRSILDSLKSQLFSKFGDYYLLEFAESGEEGLEILDEFTNDNIKTIVIITDWLMPNMKGDEFLIKVHEKFPEIVKVMLSGQADNKAIERAKLHAGVSKFLQKPWNKYELFDAISKGLN